MKTPRYGFSFQQPREFSVYHRASSLVNNLSRGINLLIPKRGIYFCDFFGTTSLTNAVLSYVFASPVMRDYAEMELGRMEHDIEDFYGPSGMGILNCNVV